jgi:hypothetical protein
MDNGNGHPHLTQSRLVLSLTALTLAACGAALPPGLVATHQAGAAAAAGALPSPHARAEVELATLLADVRVPSGAVRVTSAPVTLLAQAQVSEASPNLLTSTSWWRIDMSFADALAWIQEHPPAGLTSGMSGRSGGPGVPTNRSLGFEAPSTTAYDGATVELDLAAMSSSTTGLRADAKVIWLPPKPSDEFVPLGTAVTLAAVNHFGSSDATTLRTRDLDPADAAALITDLNALPPSDGGARACALDTGYRVQIEAEVAGTPLVFSDWWACSEVPVTRGGATLLTLTSTPAFEHEITLLIGSPPVP